MNSDPHYFCIVERIKQRMRLTKVNWLTIAPLLLTSAGLSGQVMYPGDVNNSGQANTLDVLFLGLAWGSTGPERMSPTTAWMPQSIAPSQWSQEFSNGINYAYADCNGDGVIDQADLEEGVQANFLLEHGGNTTDDVYSSGGAQGSSPGFTAVGDKDVIFGLDTLTVDIRLGSQGNPVDQFYGAAFTVLFDPALIEGEEASFELPLAPWFDPVGGESANLVMTDLANGRIDVAITRTNQAGIDGSGSLGKFSFVIIEDVVGEFVLFDEFLQFTNIKVIGSDETDVQVFDTTAVVLKTVEKRQEPQWNLYPNPASEAIYLETGDLNVQYFRITNALGLEVQRYYPGGKQAIHTIPVGNLTPGTYFVEMYTQRGRWARKLMIP